MKKEAPLIKEFRDSMKSPDFQRELMGDLTEDPEITSESFERWFTLFFKGVQFIFMKYGVTSKRLAVCDTITFLGKTHKDMMGYIPEQDTISITRGFLRPNIKVLGNRNVFSRTGHTLNRVYSPEDCVTLLGVEMAYYAYLHKNGLFDDCAQIKTSIEVDLAIKEFRFRGVLKIVYP